MSTLENGTARKSKTSERIAATWVKATNKLLVLTTGSLDQIDSLNKEFLQNQINVLKAKGDEAQYDIAFLSKLLEQE